VIRPQSSVPSRCEPVPHHAFTSFGIDE
jgi:hypothetical protein